MKMTGHLMYGDYIFLLKTKSWEPLRKTGPLRDPYNRFIHLVFTFKKNKHLVFSDTRRFAKVFLFDTKKHEEIPDLTRLGPDPLSKKFSLTDLKERLYLRPNGKIKQVLLDQSIIAGIGNIYSDEILWSTGIHPLSIVQKINEEKIKSLWKNSKIILKKGIDFGGDSMSDYRNIDGKPGSFQNKHNVYRKVGKTCSKKDGGVIKRIKVGGRSTHFCDKHQILYK